MSMRSVFCGLFIQTFGFFEKTIEFDMCLQGVVYAGVSTGAALGEDLARKERERIMELIESQGMPLGSYMNEV